MDSFQNGSISDSLFSASWWALCSCERSLAQGFTWKAFRGRPSRRHLLGSRWGRQEDRGRGRG